MAPFRYRPEEARRASFPLGGIGTGSIGLSAGGRLIDWQIFNRPNKGGFNGFSHFAIRTERAGEVLDARVLNGPFELDAEGDCGRMGIGARRETLVGLPHFAACEMDGRFPIATLAYSDPASPVLVRQTAFNPFIPHNEDDSSIPCAMFEFEVENPTDAPVDATIFATLRNPCPGSGDHRLASAGDGAVLHLKPRGIASDALAFGDLALATDSKHHAAQLYWFRGQWFDSMQVYWSDISRPGAPPSRSYDGPRADRHMHAETDHATLAATAAVPAGGTATLRFAVTWNYPNCEAYWLGDDPVRRGHRWRNWYATRWLDAAESAAYVLGNWQRLRSETLAFRDALFASTLPAPALDAVSANLSTLKSPTALRLEDGQFWGWEGVWGDHGAWQGTCSHVWAYAQAMPFLFPRLERGLRETEFTHNLMPDGGLSFRTMLPLGSGPFEVRPCCDGQFATILRTYRDWKISGDTAWLGTLWEAMTRAMAFAWSPENPDRWDPEATGILWGRQHHTLDMELFGPNSWLTSMYLAALKAMSEMGAALGEAGAERYRAVYESGRAQVEELLFNGSYYVQRLEIGDRSAIEPYDWSNAGLAGVVHAGFVDTYWDPEHGEIKYQLGEGCLIDQALGQWHADLYGLGDVLDRDHVRSALGAVYAHNFRPSFRDFANPSRIYAYEDEAGTMICAWPEGAAKPVIPVPYAEETFHGMEYAAAGHMILNGLVEEGERLVRAVRERYDGRHRNPWGEMEHGFHYARSMASYALLNAYSRPRFDLARGLLGFDPVIGGDFRVFFSVGECWGTLESSGAFRRIRIASGRLTLERLWLGGHRAVSVETGGVALDHAQAEDEIVLAAPIALRAGETLEIKLVER